MTAQVPALLGSAIRSKLKGALLEPPDPICQAIVRRTDFVDSRKRSWVSMYALVLLWRGQRLALLPGQVSQKFAGVTRHSSDAKL